MHIRFLIPKFRGWKEESRSAKGGTVVKGLRLVLGSEFRVPQDGKRKAEMTVSVWKRVYNHKMDVSKVKKTVTVVSKPENECWSFC